MSDSNFKTTIFRVKIQKSKPKATNKVNNISPKSNIKKGYNKCEGVNLYMTSASPLKIPDPPKELLNYIQCYKNASLTNPKNIHNKTKTINVKTNKTDFKKKKINEFIAFRSYYSRCCNGMIPQLQLSKILAKLWHSNPKLKKTWVLFSEQYNVEQPEKSFTDWLKKTYKSDYNSNIEKQQGYDTEFKIQGPYIEDVYYNMNNKKSIYKIPIYCINHDQKIVNEKDSTLNSLLNEVDMFEMLDDISSF